MCPHAVIRMGFRRVCKHIGQAKASLDSFMKFKIWQNFLTSFITKLMPGKFLYSIKKYRVPVGPRDYFMIICSKAYLTSIENFVK